MAGGIGSNLGAGLGAQQQQSNFTNPSKQVDQPVIQPSRGGENVNNAQQASQAAVNSEAAAEAVHIAERPKTRKLSTEDLNRTLLQNGIQPTADAKEMASLMMQYGLELSRENFDELRRLTQGKKDSATMESAIIAKSKGVLDQSALNGLRAFLFENQHIAKQLESFQQAAQSFQKSLSAFQNLDPGLVTGLNALMTNFSDEIKKLLKKEGKDLSRISEFRRNGLIKDVFSLIQLLRGIEEKFVQQKNYKDMLAQFPKMKEASNRLLNNLMAQNIISKSSEQQLSDVMETFAYWQIPNLMSKKTENAKIDLLIKKEKKDKRAPINSQRTKLIINLETPELGLLTMILTVYENKIWYVFNAEKESTVKQVAELQKDLRDRMAAKNYEMAGFQAIKKKVDIKKYMLPTFELDAIKRIDAEV